MRHEQGFLLLQLARTERPGRLSTNGLSQGQMSGCESFEKYRLTWQELKATILVSLRTIWLADKPKLFEIPHLTLRHGSTFKPSIMFARFNAPRRAAPENGCC